MADRWIRYGYLARYGNQPIHALLGRPPRPDEISLLYEAVGHWVERENESARAATSTTEG